MTSDIDIVDQELIYVFQKTFNFDTIHRLIIPHLIICKAHHVSWHLLHSFSVCYPENPSEPEKEAALNFIKNIKTYFKYCSNCNSNALLDFELFYNLNNANHAVQTSDNLIQFFINFHGFINSSFKKNYDINQYTVEFIKNKYTNNNFQECIIKKYNIDLCDLVFNNKLDQLYILLLEMKKKIFEEDKDKFYFTFEINYKV